MLRILIDLARQGERVFAVVGSGHVIRQEWNLRATFGMDPAWDQPASEELEPTTLSPDPDGGDPRPSQ